MGSVPWWRAVTALLDDHGQAQGNCGVWSNFSLPEFTNRSKKTQSGEIPAGRGETLLEKFPFFTCGARETQSSNLRDCQNHEPLTTSHVSNLKEIVDSQGGCDNPYCTQASSVKSSINLSITTW